MWRNLYLLRYLYLISSKIKYILVCTLFIGKMLFKRVKCCESENPLVIQNKMDYSAKKEDAEMHLIIQIFGQYWSQLKVGEYQRCQPFGFLRNPLFFKVDFRITISDVKIPQNNDFQVKMVPDKIKDVTLIYTPVLRTFYVAVDYYTWTPVVNNWLVCVLFFIGKSTP